MVLVWPGMTLLSTDVKTNLLVKVALPFFESNLAKVLEVIDYSSLQPSQGFPADPRRAVKIQPQKIRDRAIPRPAAARP
jgi:hypothetical protein